MTPFKMLCSYKMEPGHNVILELSISLTQKTQRGQQRTERVLREVCFQTYLGSNTIVWDDIKAYGY